MTTAPLPAIPAQPPEIGDQRGAKRAALMIRSAKLICESGEYVCLVRDVSTTGIKLRLFHKMPPETFVFLELGNGEIHAMENKWSHGEEAGFRFVAPVDVDSFINEPSRYPRRQLRLRIDAPGQLLTEGRWMPVKLRDLSQSGARIETTHWLALNQPVRLQLEGMPERIGQVRWRNRYDHGVAFQNVLRLDDLARQAKMLQPFAAAKPKIVIVPAAEAARATG